MGLPTGLARLEHSQWSPETCQNSRRHALGNTFQAKVIRRIVENQLQIMGVLGAQPPGIYYLHPLLQRVKCPSFLAQFSDKA
eukprot:5147822-Karenia_brevis.AAC.1